jgi:two-component system, LytTR family, sensor kinase
MMPPDHPAKANLWPSRFGVLGGWVLFTVMVLAISWGGTAVRGRKFDLANTITWNLGWILWAGATFVVAALVRRFPIERKRLAHGVVVHVMLGLAIVTLTQGMELALNRALVWLCPEVVRPYTFVELVVYKFHIYFLIYWMILGATRAFDYYARYREGEVLASQLEAQLAQAQLQALKNQLHPHFLFNTHHSIISLMLKNEAPTAIRMLTRLSDLLRITLRQTDQQVSSLREELDALDLYLGIQRERYRDRLAVQLDIEPTTLTAEVPCLLLQPLVENALQHGIEPLAAGGLLRIAAHQEHDRLVLTISDNGAGVAGDIDLENGPGIGLRNTRARLTRLYGAQQNFAIARGGDGGTEVRIMLPFRRSAHE